MTAVIYKSNEEAQEACVLWQKRLRLQDWIVSTSIRRQRDMSLNGQAEVEWVAEKKMAAIALLDPVDYPPGAMVPQDMEWSLVHELIHLHMAPIDNFHDGHGKMLLEQAVDSLAWAYVNLSREEEGRSEHAHEHNDVLHAHVHAGGHQAAADEPAPSTRHE